MVVGSILYAVGVALLLDPNNLAPGGVSGVSILLSRFLPVNIGTLVFLLNIPILAVGLWKLGIKVIGRSIFCIFVTSFFMDIFSANLGAITEDKVLAAIAGAVVSAAGIGLVMRQGGTTGGTDIIIKLLRLKFPHIKTGAFLMTADLTVVVVSAFIFQDIEVAMYAAVAVGIASFTLDKVLYGTDGAKMIYIVTDKNKDIATRLVEDLNTGVTLIQGKGAYSGNPKEIVFVVVRKVLAPKVEEIIKEVDPKAFMIVSSAHEIYGQGYKNLFGERL